jgi:hypothetical protein
LQWDDYKTLLSSEYDTQGLPYDYDSITHYNKFDCAIDKSIPTITTYGEEREIGQRKSISPLDIVRIKKMYRCQLSDADKRAICEFMFYDFIIILILTRNFYCDTNYVTNLQRNRVKQFKHHWSQNHKQSQTYQLQRQCDPKIYSQIN